MDEIALASIITSGVVGLAGVGVGLWSTRENAKVAREGRVQERRIDGYLEALSLMEHERMAADVRYRRANSLGEPYNDMPAPVDPLGVDDKARLRALIVAFGSASLTRVFDAWSSALDGMMQRFEISEWNYGEYRVGADTPMHSSDLERLGRQLSELASATADVEAVIAAEIEQMRSGTAAGAP